MCFLPREDSEGKQIMSSEHQNGRSHWLGAAAFQRHSQDREKVDLVSELMTNVLNPVSVWAGTMQDPAELRIPSGRRQIVADAIRSWGFSAHDFNQDELVYAAFLMFDHVLKIQDLEKWRLKSHDLKVFLMTTRAAYNDSVIYHNFRHAIDVLQATFYFLLQIEALPPFPETDKFSSNGGRSCYSTPLLKAADALTLLVAAIGHDVGHPGVNNKFLIKVHSPLAQVYSNRSVLESFHSAAFSQILRLTWKSFYDDTEMLALMTSSILATDMAVHGEYIHILNDLQRRFTGADLDAYDKRSICGLLIKCADISNVARAWNIAFQWTELLQNEFLEQGRLEEAAGIETALPGGPPNIHDERSLAKGQIFFIEMFADPLFRGVSEILPSLMECYNILDDIITIWKSKLDSGLEVPRSRNSSREGSTLSNRSSYQRLEGGKGTPKKSRSTTLLPPSPNYDGDIDKCDMMSGDQPHSKRIKKRSSRLRLPSIFKKR
ncbi:MAG: 3',5'-cyclic-nucleotide phosphodiesterase [Cirrosporium novae-zelandiae]|nr:MAG: 3',5'-cyclic-nucleotide phosphodiesterase [Cirrosporium novae-zelandiae]